MKAEPTMTDAEIRALLDAATPGRIDVHRCDADSGTIDHQLQRAPGRGGSGKLPATVLGYATDSDGSPRAKADATLWSKAHAFGEEVLRLRAYGESAEASVDNLRDALERAERDVDETQARLDALANAVRRERAAKVNCRQANDALEAHQERYSHGRRTPWSEDRRRELAEACDAAGREQGEAVRAMKVLLGEEVSDG